MIQLEENKNIWQRMRVRYRVSLFNEEKLSEVWHIHISRASFWAAVMGAMLLTFFLFALIIWFTPLKGYLPGFNATVREDLIQETARVDSLNREMQLQIQYMSVIRDVIAGNIETDSVHSLDSLSMVEKEELQAAYSAATEEFRQQYEERDKDYLMLFDEHGAAPTVTLFRPVTGLIQSSQNEGEGRLGVEVQTAQNAPIVAVLSGTVVYCDYNVNTAWTLVLQHDGDYTSVYTHVAKPLRTRGMHVQPGEVIGLASANHCVGFELWQKGNALNPETVILW